LVKALEDSQSVWRKASHFIEEGKILVYPNSVSSVLLPPTQGSLGDCYLIAALLSLSSFPACIERLFTNEVNEAGIYGVRIVSKKK
jgi:hypothetical protein